MSRPSENTAFWSYPLIRTSEDKQTSRMGVQPGWSSELLGVDGVDQAGQRVAPGWRFVRELEFYNDSRHDETSIVSDMRIVNFRIGSSYYGYGVVYRATRSTAQASSASEETASTVEAEYLLADVFVDFWSSRTGEWSTGNKIMEGVSPTDLFDVAAVGRLVYCFVKGRSPARFYVDDNEAVQVLGQTDAGPFPGPGIMPELISPEDVVTPLGTLSPPADTDQPARGQVVLTLLLPSQTGVFTHSSTTDSSSGPCGTLDDNAQDASAFPLEIGDYVFSYQLFDSRTGQWSALSEIAQCRGRDFNLLPGRSTSSSGTAEDFRDHYAALEIVYDQTEFDRAYIYRSVNVQAAGGTFAAAVQQLDNIIDLCEYHTAQQPDDQGGRYRRAVYFYQLEDKQLVMQKPYVERATFDEQMPFGGAAEWYENTMVVGGVEDGGTVSSPGVNRPRDDERGLGELRWSTIGKFAPELFPPDHRYTLKVPANEVIRLVQLGGNIIGFSRDRSYHMRKAGQFIEVDEMHTGYGLVSPRSVDVTGTFAYFVSHKGLKALDSVGQLDDVNALNQPLVVDWDGTRDSVSCAFDPFMSAFFILNADLEHTIILWMNTNKITEMRDSVFTQVVRGTWPTDPVDWSDALTERAVFLQNTPEPGTAVGGWKPRLFVWDAGRDKTIEGSGAGWDGYGRITTLDPTGDTRFSVQAADYEEALGVVRVGSGLGGEAKFGDRVEGCYLYVVESDEVEVGTKAKIAYRLSSEAVVIVEEHRDRLAGLAIGDKVALSPVYFRWVGHPIALQDEMGNAYSGSEDLTLIKHISSLGATFEDVMGAAADDPIVFDKYRGLVFRGNDNDPLTAAEGRDNSGAVVDTVVDGEAIHWAFFGTQSTSLRGRYGVRGFNLTPGVEVVCPDLDFRLLGVSVDGKITGSRTGTRRE